MNVVHIALVKFQAQYFFSLITLMLNVYTKFLLLGKTDHRSYDRRFDIPNVE